MLTRLTLLLAGISHCSGQELLDTQDHLYHGQYLQTNLAQDDRCPLMFEDQHQSFSRTDPGLVDFAVNIPVMLMAFLSALLGGM